MNDNDTIRFPANTLRAGDVIKVGFQRTHMEMTSITYNGTHYIPDIQPRASLPPVEIFDRVPALAVEVTDDDGRRVIEMWRNGDRIETSGLGWFPVAEWDALWKDDPLRCVPCERGDIFARVPWPEGI